MKFELTATFKKKAKKLFRKDPQLRKHFIKQFKIFEKNHQHPSLKLHKLKGKRSNEYAIWIKGNVRAVAISENRVYIFFTIITHDEY